MRSDSATTLLLIRHGHTAAIGRRLIGRLEGIGLSREGRDQALMLVERLAAVRVDALYSSPLQRAIETAAPLARARALEIHQDEGLTEIDFGAWTNRTFDELASCREWQDFNEHRSTGQPPGGESAVDAQQRVVAALHGIVRADRGKTIAVVTHADVIRSAVLFYRRLSLDCIHDIEVEPGSITTVRCGGPVTDPLQCRR